MLLKSIDQYDNLFLQIEKEFISIKDRKLMQIDQILSF